MSLSVEAYGDYHDDCGKIGFVDVKGSSVAKNSVSIFNWYLEIYQSWKRGGENPFRKSNVVNHAATLERCVRGRIRRKEELSEPQTDAGHEKRVRGRIRGKKELSDGHDHVIKILLFHIFFIQVVQSLENKLDQEEALEPCEAVDVKEHDRIKWQEYNQGSVCADLYEKLQASCAFSSTECELYDIFSDAGKNRNDARPDPFQFNEKIKEIVKIEESRAKTLQELFKSVFNHWALDIKAIKENLHHEDTSSSRASDPGKGEPDIYTKFANSKFGDFTPAGAQS